MARINSTRSVPVVFAICAVVSVILLGACFAAERFLSPERRDFINWVSAKEALSKAKSLNKPILYDFSAEWCGPCKMLQKEVFADKDSAKFVNRCFVPVHVIDRQREDGANDFEIEKLQKMYHVTGFPTLAIVKSSGSDVAKIVGYQGKEETMKFFTKALIPRTMFGGGGVEIEWKSLDEQFDEWPESKKPLLVLFWNENGESSRYQYLSNQELVRTIEKNFLPVEVSVPISPSAARSEKAKELLKVLSVKRTPALVIVPADGSLPHFQFGDTEADDNLVFLKTFLRLSPH